ncbi:serine/threonine-protein kinase Sgk2-like [Xenopus laevis]|uniref:Serine/threonine-protein kinase Sgk2-like n=1 Tax=Xenopus laevis TaxID=8355 RepID=A0A8J1LBI7_XENLA|nr:serine/threonine-protein kinase Sgk2-like [Xenopus laevis]
MKRIHSNSIDSDPPPSKEKKRREDHEEEQEESQKEKIESSLEEQLSEKGCREESIPSGFKDSDPQPSKVKKRKEDHEEEGEENQKERRESSLEKQLPEKGCREESIPSGFKDSDPQPSKVKKRRKEHEEEGEENQKEKRESSLEKQLPGKGCREESILSGLKDSDPQSSKVKKSEDHEEEEGKKQKKKRERSVDDHLQVECYREKKPRRQETDEGEAGPVSAEAQPSRLNPLSISSYNFYSKLGAGGYGKVMLASLGDRRPYVAVKSVGKRELPDYSNLLSESQVLNIGRHSPFLCQGFAAFQTQWHAFFVMEYLSGGSLEDELKRHGTLPIERVRFHSAEMICGLQYLHGLGIIHRDIKPMNVLLDHQGHVKICDFGLAKQSIFDGDLTTGRAGTIEYMAPEMLNRKTYNAAVDWWSFGITICKITTGMSPFHNSGNMDQLICSIKNHEPNIPDWLDEDLKHLLGQLLEKNRKQRLGVRGNIRCHPFYKAIDWVALEEERLQPPYQPRTPPPDLFQPCKEKLSFLEYKEDEGTSGGSDIIPGFSFQSSTWLT